MNIEPNYTIAAIARELSRYDSTAYAKANAPRSPHPELTGNREPGVTRLRWLAGLNKCNQFVGDVLTWAGLLMPTYRMPDGSKHYMHAEALPRQSSHFTRVTSINDMLPGDLLVLDWAGRGENGAHVEIVTAIDHAAQRIWTTGARRSGATEAELSAHFAGASYEPSTRSWRNSNSVRGSYAIYVLRTLPQS